LPSQGGRTKNRRTKSGSEVKVDAADPRRGVKKSDAEADRGVIQGDQSEGAESPENEGMGEPGQGSLLDDLSLADHFPEEIPCTASKGGELEVGVFSGVDNFMKNGTEPAPEERSGADDEEEKEKFLNQGKGLRFG
jgi:hypothetical protein